MKTDAARRQSLLKAAGILPTQSPPTPRPPAPPITTGHVTKIPTPSKGGKH